MLIAIIIVVSLILFLYMPVLALKRYYSPSQYSLMSNIGWIFIGIVSWPLIPVIIAMRKKDVALIVLFWASLLVWSITVGYWFTINFSKYVNIL